MNKKYIKELILYFISTVLVSVLGFLISLLYSSMFSPKSYGEYSIAYNTYALITQLYSGWISLAILRNAKKFQENKNYEKFVGTFALLHIILSIVFFICFNSIISIIIANTTLKKLFFILSVLYFFEQAITLMNTILRVEHNAKQYSLNTIINNSLKIFFTIFLYYVLNYKSIEIIVLALLLSELVQCVYLFFKFRYYSILKKDNFDFQIVKEMFLFGFPLLGLSVTNWILNVSDRYIINIFCSMNDVGMYSYAYSLGNNLFNLLIQFIMLGAYPNIVAAWEEKGKESAERVLNKYFEIYLLILVPAVFGICSISNQFFDLFVAASYRNSVLSFNVTCIAIAILGITQYYNKSWELTNKTKYVLYINIMVAAVNIILNIILIPKFGYCMGAFTTMISYMIYVFVAHILTSNILKINVAWKYLLKILVSSVIMSIVCNLIKISPIANDYVKLLIEVLFSIITYLAFILIFKAINIKETICLTFKKNKTGGIIK